MYEYNSTTLVPTGAGLGDGNGVHWVLNPATGIWSIEGNSQAQESAGVSSGFVRRAVVALESSTAPMAEPVDIRGIYSNAHGSGYGAVSGIRLGGVVAGDVGDAVRIQDLHGVKVPFYDGIPEKLEDFLWDWKDFADEVMGGTSQVPPPPLCRSPPPPGGRSPSDGPPPPLGGPHYHRTRTFAGTEIAA